MRKIKFKILGKNWTLRVLSDKKFNAKHGAENVAMTISWKHRIDIPKSFRDLDTVTHELVHAYLAELCMNSTSMSKDDAEEVFAELMARRGRELLKLAKELHKKVKAL